MDEWPETARFGERVRALREARGWSLEDAAFETRKAGRTLSIGYIGQLERGVRPPTPAALYALSAIYEEDLGDAPEFLLERARAMLDERLLSGGIPEALQNLRELAPGLERALERDADAIGLPPGGELERLARAGARAETGRSESDRGRESRRRSA